MTSDLGPRTLYHLKTVYNFLLVLVL